MLQCNKCDSRAALSAEQAGERTLAPELARVEPRALGHAGELGPDHGGIDRGLPAPGAVAAIAAGDDVLAADQLGVAGEALGDEFGMLDEIVLDSRTPGMRTLPAGSFTASNTVHSWAWRGLAASKERPLGLARKTTSMMSLSGTSQ